MTSYMSTSCLFETIIFRHVTYTVFAIAQGASKCSKYEVLFVGFVDVIDVFYSMDNTGYRISEIKST